MRSFEEFIAGFGFESYPFASFTAENERDQAKDIFVKPEIHSPVLQNFRQGSSIILIGERGTGKTAFLYDLLRNLDEKSLAIYLDDFAQLPEENDEKKFYAFLLSSLSEALIERLLDWTRLSKTASKDDRALLSLLLTHHVPIPSQKRLAEKLSKIQHPWYERWFVKAVNIFGGLINQGASVAIQATGDMIRNALGLPNENSNTYRQYFKSLELTTETTFQGLPPNLGNICKVAKLAKRLGLKQIIFILDKIDEDARLENDAEHIAKFILPVLRETKNFTTEDFQIVIAVWAIPFYQIKDDVRTQKLCCEQIKWTRSSLEALINRRLTVFSKEKIGTLKECCSTSVTDAELSQFYDIANGNPRDAWHALDKIFRSQFLTDSSCSKIDTAAFAAGIKDFVSTFNFYEYYPRRSKARANTMDVYSYIAHLLKLEAAVFTKNVLNEKAGTGGSTNNYVASMENMGLISKKEEKDTGGGVQYQIRDPKITYAIKNELDIRKES